MKSTPLTQGIAVVRLMVQSGHSLGVTTIANALHMPKSSVHRLLQSLQELKFVQRLESGRYALCADIFDFIHEIVWNFGRNLRLESQLREAANRLGSSVYLSMLGRHDTFVICAAGEEGNTSRLGMHSPAHASSAGKILIAQQPRSRWMQYAPLPDETPLTRFTNLSPRKFIEEIKNVRKRGLAWNNRETSPAHVSLAAIVREPFIPEPRIAVALVLRQEDYELRDPSDLEKQLLELAAELELELGSR